MAVHFGSTGSNLATGLFALMPSYVTQNETETRELGRRLGEQLQPGTVIGLSGTLGAGKTRFVQGIGLGLGIAADSICSPTYTICVPYSGRLPLYHLDAYRIVDLAEVDELALDELVEEGAVVVIEWSERISSVLPAMDLRVSIEQTSMETRVFELVVLSDRMPWFASVFPESQ